MNHTFKALAIVSFLAISSLPMVAITFDMRSAAANNPVQTIIAKAESKGGQVIETQGYHLEFVPEKTAKGMHLDFYLQRSDNHAAIGNANVKAEITMPDGKKQTVPLKYDAKEKHYTAIVETKATGDFKVVMLSDIAGKKVNGRFSFKR